MPLTPPRGVMVASRSKCPSKNVLLKNGVVGARGPIRYVLIPRRVYTHYPITTRRRRPIRLTLLRTCRKGVRGPVCLPEPSAVWRVKKPSRNSRRVLIGKCLRVNRFGTSVTVLTNALSTRTISRIAFTGPTFAAAAAAVRTRTRGDFVFSSVDTVHFVGRLGTGRIGSRTSSRNRLGSIDNGVDEKRYARPPVNKNETAAVSTNAPSACTHEIGK